MKAIKDMLSFKVENNILSELSGEKIKNNRNNQDENDGEDEFDKKNITEAVKRL